MSKSKNDHANIFRLWPLALLFIFCSNLGAATYQLYSPSSGAKSRPHPEYLSILEKLSPGDIVRFSNGQEVTLGKKVGQGNSTWIFDILGSQPPQVIRIPGPSIESDFTLNSTRKMLDRYAKTAKNLSGINAPVPKIFPEQSLPSEFLVVEKIEDISFSLHQLVIYHDQDFGPPSITSKDPREIKLLFDQLNLIKQDIKNWYNVDDLHLGNIVWVESRGWIVLDFAGSTPTQNLVTYRKQIGLEPVIRDYNCELIAKIKRERYDLLKPTESGKLASLIGLAGGGAITLALFYNEILPEILAQLEE